MNSAFKKFFLKVTAASDCQEVEVIQSLWSGYGKISRYQLHSSNYVTVVVKHISPSQAKEHPRGWNTDLSHQRKIKSYQIETAWYEKWSAQCDEDCKIPNFVGSYTEEDDQWIILEDLNNNYPITKKQVNHREIKVCLRWLANFHATFLNKEPNDLWPVGTYWHLATRPDEFDKIANQELKSKAHLIDDTLSNCQYQTIVHGDAKLANFCFSVDGSSVAGVDFQYVGGGCGMKDVAYFLGSCLNSDELNASDKDLLDYYFAELQKAIDLSDKNINFTDLEKEWRLLYPMACADFSRFLLGWMPEHQKANDYQLNLLDTVLANL